MTKAKQMTFYCLEGNQEEPYYWYDSAESCQEDSGYPKGHPDLKIIEIEVAVKVKETMSRLKFTKNCPVCGKNPWWCDCD